jgi:hypothetical protein
MQVIHTFFYFILTEIPEVGWKRKLKLEEETCPHTQKKPEGRQKVV